MQFRLWDLFKNGTSDYCAYVLRILERFEKLRFLNTALCVTLREQLRSRDLDIWHLQETPIANLDSNLRIAE